MRVYWRDAADQRAAMLDDEGGTVRGADTATLTDHMRQKYSLHQLLRRLRHRRRLPDPLPDQALWRLPEGTGASFVLPALNFWHPATNVARLGLQEIGCSAHIVPVAITGSEYHFIVQPGPQWFDRIQLQQGV